MKQMPIYEITVLCFLITLPELALNIIQDGLCMFPSNPSSTNNGFVRLFKYTHIKTHKGERMCGKVSQSHISSWLANLIFLNENRILHNEWIHKIFLMCCCPTWILAKISSSLHNFYMSFLGIVHVCVCVCIQKDYIMHASILLPFIYTWSEWKIWY